MPSVPYILGALAVVLVITFALRAVPFSILGPLRESATVRAMATWMPVGILAILAASTFLSTAGGDGGRPLCALLAVAVTAAVHLLGGRRTLLSVGAGTLTYVLLVAFV
jgi:branched-subunit amino acid transport protein AzlD